MTDRPGWDEIEFFAGVAMTVSRGACRNAIALSIFLASTAIAADVVTDANAKAGDFIAAAKLAHNGANYRAAAIVQVAVFEAVNAVTGRTPYRPGEGRMGRLRAPTFGRCSRVPVEKLSCGRDSPPVQRHCRKPLLRARSDTDPKAGRRPALR